MNNEGINPHLTTRIVSTYVKHHTVGVDQISELITSVHRALGQLGQPVQPQEVLSPAVSVRRSVNREYVVCLDCGYRGKTLRRHIATRHGLTRDDYLKRWGLKGDHPLTAPGYSEQRSMLAKELGLGRNPSMQAVTPARTATPASTNTDSNSETKPTRRRSTRSASKSADGAVAPPTRKRKSPSRVRPQGDNPSLIKPA